MRVLVTGGAGFIGSHLCERLLHEGYQVKSYDLKRSHVCGSIVGNITDRSALFRHLKNYDCAFHLAAMANTDDVRCYPEKAVETNIKGTYVVAECCSQLQIPLNFVSTACVYGDTPNHPSDVNSVCVPTDLYGSTKLVGEAIVKQISERKGLDYNILRYGTTYGPRMREALAVYIFIKKALEGKPLPIHGSGRQTRCMIYIDDLVDAQIKLLEKGVLSETFNLATEEELSVLEIANMILELTGRPKESFEFVEDRPGQIMRESLDISKAKKLLEWSPKTTFEEGLKKTLSWAKTEI